jgi:glycosyltransferase involved in cell wall biosynthesis
MPILKDAKCLVHTSDFEGFGLVLVEALALNIPVIARDCPSGPSEILTGKLRENLIPLNNYQLLSQRMSEICNQNADLDFGLYIQKFLAQNIIKQYEKLEYSHVC